MKKSEHTSYKPFTLRKGIVLGKLGKHDGLFSLVLDKDMTRRWDDRFQSPEGSHKGPIGQHFVAKGPTGAARIAVHLAFGTAVLDELLVALQHFEIVGRPHTKLHGGTGLFTAHLTMAPTGQGWVTRDFGFKSSTHASVFASRHDDGDR
eukprot:scaffold111_cov149-Amphora_coffeaeformis.AAC.3